MKKVLLILLCFHLIFISVSAKVSNEAKLLANELKLKYEKDDAVLLSLETLISFERDDFGNITALEETNEDIISLRLNNSFNRPISYDAYSEVVSVNCFNADGGKKFIVPICGNLEQDGVFYSDSKMCLYPIFLSSIGDKITIKYKKKYTDLKYLNSIYFQENYPIAHRSVRVVVPKWLSVGLPEFNFNALQIDKSVKSVGGDQIYEFKSKNLPAIKKEENDVGISFTYPHILVLSKKVLEGNSKVQLISNLSDQYSWYHTLVRDLKYNEAILKPTVTQLTANCKSDSAKIEAIFYWIQDNIRYIAFEDGIAGFKPDEADFVFEKRFGDCKGMANLTKSMMMIAGFDARLTWLGTNHVYYDYSIPSLAVDNHMICTVILNGKLYYLDATEKYVKISDYAERIQGRQVLIENKIAFLLDTIPVLSNTRNLMSRRMNFKLLDDNLVGNYDFAYNGEIKMDIYRTFNFKQNGEALDLAKKLIIQNDNNKKILTLDMKNLYNRQGSFILKGDIEIDNKISSFDNQLYIDIDPYQDFKAKSLSKDRISNFQLGEKMNLCTDIQLEIPNGYSVSSLPDPINVSNKLYSFRGEYLVVNGVIKYNKTLLFKVTSIPVEHFAEWNNNIEQLDTFYSNQIILTKK